MTAQVMGAVAAFGLLAWTALDVVHLRGVRRWASSRSRARIPRDDQPWTAILGAALFVVLSPGLVMQWHWAFAVTVLVAAAGSVVESAVRVVPHLRAGERGLAMNHIVMGIICLAVLILAAVGWNYLPPLVPGA